MFLTGFTLFELLIVIIIIGILASLGVVNYSKTTENTLDKEAFANLRLMQAAQKIYKMEMGHYYGDANVITDINDNLRLSLPAETNWGYFTKGGTNSTTSGCAQANRKANNLRQWYLGITSDNDPENGTCP
jgi:prepilin-type N-terminal cleavage/methylation domain-containing protein